MFSILLSYSISCYIVSTHPYSHILFIDNNPYLCMMCLSSLHYYYTVTTFLPFFAYILTVESTLLMMTPSCVSIQYPNNFWAAEHILWQHEFFIPRRWSWRLEELVYCRTERGIPQDVWRVEQGKTNPDEIWVLIVVGVNGRKIRAIQWLDNFLWLVSAYWW